MWERFVNSSSSAAATTTVTPPPAALSQSPDVASLPLRSGTGNQRQPLARIRAACRGTKAGVWHNEPQDPFNAPGISQGPCKYEIRGGKVVPQAAHVVLPVATRHRNLLAASPVCERPRLSPRQQQPLPQRGPGRHPHTPASESGGAAGSIDSDEAPEMPPTKPVSGVICSHAADNGISPPSSPDSDPSQDWYMPGDVSPIDDEVDVRRHPLGVQHSHRWNRASKTPYGLCTPPGAGLQQARINKRPGFAQPDETNRGYASDLPPRRDSLPDPSQRPTRAHPASLAQRVCPATRERPDQTRRAGDDLPPASLPRRSERQAGHNGERPMPSVMAVGGNRGPETSGGGAPTASTPRPQLLQRPSGSPQSRPSAQPCHSNALPSLPPPAITKRKPPPPGNAHSAAQTRASASPCQDQHHPLPRPAASTEDASASRLSWRQPASRFSATTFAASNLGTPRQPTEAFSPLSTPRTQPEPPTQVRSPSPHQNDEAATASDQGSFVLTNSPSPSWTLNQGKSPVPRPAHRQSHAGPMMDKHLSDCRSSIFSLRKPLPLSPPELSSTDSRIAQPNVRLQGLAHRRANLIRSIEQMTELMPIDSLFASEQVLHKREVEKQKVVALKDELAQLQREEYDLGLKLHRARKRQEKEADYEQSALWVRRVTG